MGPKRVKTKRVGTKEEKNNKEDVLERNAESSNSGGEQRGEREKKRRVKSEEEREQILLGLRFSKRRLHFLFRGHEGVVERWRFRGAGLADNHWHTLVLGVGSQRVRLTVDCGKAQEM